mmetsp:Transcript_56566/g.106111  ORF Transcript_56566/g.106111 Transcript_56566/m.106111 type:complete len:156 (-) Transcript_56566:250-717(-)
MKRPSQAETGVGRATRCKSSGQEQEVCDGGVAAVSVRVAALRASGYTDFQAWLADAKNLYVGRRGRIFIHSNGSKRIFHYVGSKWQNPYAVGSISRQEACKKYESALLSGMLKDPQDGKPLHQKLSELKGYRLGCWCKPQACHADILAALANQTA